MISVYNTKSRNVNASSEGHLWGVNNPQGASQSAKNVYTSFHSWVLLPIRWCHVESGNYAAFHLLARRSLYYSSTVSCNYKVTRMTTSQERPSLCPASNTDSDASVLYFEPNLHLYPWKKHLSETIEVHESLVQPFCDR